MTFYEAALAVLTKEGKPLHVTAITELAMKENLLSHVGKSPEETMQSRLLAMARRKQDRRIVATAACTYGLVEWGVPEDPGALDYVPPQPEAMGQPPLRPKERHPAPSPENVRASGRGERRGREEWEERKKRRKFPPLSEVAFEILSANGAPMLPVDLAAAARDKELVGEDLGTETLLNALREDNRRRGEAGRKPAFSFLPGGEIVLEKVEREPEEKVERPERREERGPGAARLVAQAMEHRRQIVRLLRRRLSELDAFPFEKACQALLEQAGYRDAKVAKRNREGPLLTARKREGLIELRYAIRLVKGGREVEKEDLDHLRRDMGHYGAQVGLLLSPSDASRDARQEASSTAAPLTVLLCAEPLAEKFMELRLGSTTTTVEVYDLDDAFFRRCKERGQQEERDREARRGLEERDERRPRDQAPSPGATQLQPTPVSEAERRADAAAIAAEINRLAPPSETRGAGQPPDADRLRADAHERAELEYVRSRATASAQALEQGGGEGK